jgi:hypothetical protein
MGSLLVKSYSQETKTMKEDYDFSAGKGGAAVKEAAVGKLVEQTKAVNGFRPFPPRGGIVTNELIDALREVTA